MEVKQEPLNPVDNKPVRLSRVVRFIIFMVLVTLSIVMSGDNGIVSSCSEEIKRDLKLNDKEYGLFGSLPGTGRIFGSVIFMFILSIFDNRKYITLVALCINGSMFYAYYFTTNKYILYGVRMTIGVVRIYPFIFNDMWVNQYGIQKLKTMMITAFKITSPLGQTFGYTVGSLIPEGNYVIGFAIIGSSILLVGSVLLFCPSTYFMRSYGFVGYFEEEKLVTAPTERTSASYFHNEEKEDKKKTGGTILNILGNGSYLTALYVRANLIFILQVIHLNIKSYTSKGLGVKDNTELLKYYVPASGFGPTVGGFAGGAICTFLGGYQHKNSAFYVLATAILTLIAIIPVAFSSSMKLLGLSLFGLFFFASAMFPITVRNNLFYLRWMAGLKMRKLIFI
ncbi:MAG: hypothetical protein MJ252_23530 [archaeon]|nr:hypothetical protein [archaeon]